MVRGQFIGLFLRKPYNKFVEFLNYFVNWVNAMFKLDISLRFLKTLKTTLPFLFRYMEKWCGCHDFDFERCFE